MKTTRIPNEFINENMLLLRDDSLWDDRFPRKPLRRWIESSFSYEYPWRSLKAHFISLSSLQLTIHSYILYDFSLYSSFTYYSSTFYPFLFWSSSIICSHSSFLFYWWEHCILLSFHMFLGGNLGYWASSWWHRVGLLVLMLLHLLKLRRDSILFLLILTLHLKGT